MGEVATVRPLEVVEVDLGPSDESPGLLDVEVVTPVGARQSVPAFITDGRWKFRYASGGSGEHRYRTEALGGIGGAIRVAGPPGAAAALQVRVAADGRAFETADGSPFLWLADTWWDALTDRVTDAELAELAARRRTQGFSVIQLVAGLYPEMSPFSREGELEGSWAWQPDFGGLSEQWFDRADARVRVIVGEGLVPCITGAWGYYLQHMSVHQMVRHWRELVARWGAYPVVWCLAGEVTALDPEQVLAAAGELEAGRPGPATLSRLAGRAARIAAGSAVRRGPKGFPNSKTIATLLGIRSQVGNQVTGWHTVARAVRSMDPYRRLLTVHPQPVWPPYELIDDPMLIDFWMLQTGHSGYHTLASSVAQLEHALARGPRKPVIVGEVCYEGILGSSGPEMQRFLFWSHMLSGASGHTYGAQGMWGFNTPDYPAGVGGRWGELRWPEASRLPGAQHLGIGRSIMQRLSLHRLTPDPGCVHPHATRRDRIQPYAAVTNDGTRVIYFPVAGLVKNSLGFRSIRMRALGNSAWRVRFINPRNGLEEEAITIDPHRDGTVTLTGGQAGPLPSKEDWLVILTRL